MVQKISTVLKYKYKCTNIIIMSYKNKEWLEEQYKDLNKTIREISEEFKISKSTIHKWLHKHEISVRSYGRGRGRHSWVGGVKADSYGYILILKQEHPNCNSAGYVKEHRLIMEQHLNRYLEKDELVHHKDGNRLNNYIGNLELLKRSEHNSTHWDFED